MRRHSATEGGAKFDVIGGTLFDRVSRGHGGMWRRSGRWRVVEASVSAVTVLTERAKAS